MKKIALVLCTSFALAAAHAQTFNEWFRQKKTQIEYLVNQIAAYKVYTDDLEKGYRIVSGGLTSIEQWKHGEFNLHDTFFASLKKVKASVAGNRKVKQTLLLVDEMQNNFVNILSLKNFNAEEMNYLRRVRQKVSVFANASLDELSNVLEDSFFQMTDDERITRIDAIYEKTKDEYEFVQSFAIDAAMISQQRNMHP